MTMGVSLLQEFDQEMAIARKVIERLPEDKYDWAPHTKSMKAGQLASHIAQMISWVPICIAQDSLDLAGEREPFCAASRAELLAAFDKNVEDARQAIVGTGDETLMKPWVVAQRRTNVDYSAQDCSNRHFRNKPHHSSSRPDICVSASDGYTGAINLRPQRGRKSVGIYHQETGDTQEMLPREAIAHLPCTAPGDA